MAYAYGRFWAGALTVLGTLFVAAGLLMAVAILFIPLPVLTAPLFGPLDGVLVKGILAVSAALTGSLLGGPLIVAGQSLRVLLAQRQLLARLNERIARVTDG
jgi:hypothetical protein